MKSFLLTGKIQRNAFDGHLKRPAGPGVQGTPGLPAAPGFAPLPCNGVKRSGKDGPAHQRAAGDLNPFSISQMARYSSFRTMGSTRTARNGLEMDSMFRTIISNRARAAKKPHAAI